MRKLINILGGHNFFIDLTCHFLVRELICHIMCTRWSTCHQFATKIRFFTVFWPVYLHPRAVWNFISNWTVPSPRFLPCWHDKQGQSLIPGLCYEGDSGVSAGRRATQERNVRTLLCRKLRCRQKTQSSAVKKFNLHDVWGPFIVDDKATTKSKSNFGLSQLPDTFIQRIDP